MQCYAERDPAALSLIAAGANTDGIKIRWRLYKEISRWLAAVEFMRKTCLIKDIGDIIVGYMYDEKMLWRAMRNSSHYSWNSSQECEKPVSLKFY